MASGSRISDEFFSKNTAIDWIKAGGVKEDNFPRFLNHFYDPTTEKGIRFLLQQNSSKDWAKDRIGNDWSWASARSYFYESLTSPNSYIRETRLAATFRTVGQVMHLVEDLATPAHVRNDIHMPINSDKDFYEEYTNRNYKPTEGYAIYTGYEPADLSTFSSFDTFWKNNGKGLAEFTNKNFLSRDTNIDDKAYTLPVKIGEWVAKETPDPSKPPVDVRYLQGYVTDSYRPDKSGPINKLAAFSYFDFEMKKRNINKEVYTLNDGVHREYAQFLVPRAVGYAAGILNYFFRGVIELKPVAGGITGNSIKLTAKNITPNSEAMSGGTLELVLRYRNIPEVNALKAVSFPEQYKVIKLPGDNLTIGFTPQELTFTLPEPLPDWANDVTAQLVYHGQLGNEAGAVAVGFVPLKITPQGMKITPPSSGAYASTTGTGGFTGLKFSVSTDSALSGGVFELLLVHRFANKDQFQGVDPGTNPSDPKSYFTIRASDDNGVTGLTNGVSRELSFNLTKTPVPITATDLHVYLMYKSNITDSDAKALAVGYLDISEPTPIDVYNNTDKICLKGKWYDAGSKAAMTIADTNGDGYADLTDIFRHRISNIYYKPGTGSVAGSGNYLLSSTQPLEPGFGRRLGYILTDYYYSHSITAGTVINLDSRDTWTLAYDNSATTAEGFVNQHKMGAMQGYSGMYDMRGYKMHGGAGTVFDNQEYPDGVDCSWDLLRTPPAP